MFYRRLASDIPTRRNHTQISLANVKTMEHCHYETLPSWKDLTVVIGAFAVCVVTLSCWYHTHCLKRLCVCRSACKRYTSHIEETSSYSFSHVILNKVWSKNPIPINITSYCNLRAISYHICRFLGAQFMLCLITDPLKWKCATSEMNYFVRKVQILVNHTQYPLTKLSHSIKSWGHDSFASWIFKISSGYSIENIKLVNVSEQNGCNCAIIPPLLCVHFQTVIHTTHVWPWNFLMLLNNWFWIIMRNSNWEDGGRQLREGREECPLSIPIFVLSRIELLHNQSDTLYSMKFWN